jgi:hypothetical protein
MGEEIEYSETANIAVKAATRTGLGENRVIRCAGRSIVVGVFILKEASSSLKKLPPVAKCA